MQIGAGNAASACAPPTRGSRPLFLLPQCTHMVGYGCKACDQDGKCKHCDPDTGRVLRNGACVPVSQLTTLD